VTWINIGNHRYCLKHHMIRRDYLDEKSACDDRNVVASIVPLG
jgi:hypothetical protein